MKSTMSLEERMAGGLSPAQVYVIRLLSELGQLTTAELYSSIGKHYRRTVKTLERRGLVKVGHRVYLSVFGKRVFDILAERRRAHGGGGKTSM